MGETGYDQWRPCEMLSSFSRSTSIIDKRYESLKKSVSKQGKKSRQFAIHHNYITFLSASEYVMNWVDDGTEKEMSNSSSSRLCR